VNVVQQDRYWKLFLPKPHLLAIVFQV
jgi:hypothetical protein